MRLSQSRGTKNQTGGVHARCLPCLLDIVREAVPGDAGLVPGHHTPQELVAEALPLGEERGLPPLAAGEEPLAPQPLQLVPLAQPRVLLLADDAVASPATAAPQRRRRRRRAADALLRAVVPANPSVPSRPRRRAEPPQQRVPS
jgi:hypothetical protein